MCSRRVRQACAAGVCRCMVHSAATPHRRVLKPAVCANWSSLPLTRTAPLPWDASSFMIKRLLLALTA